MRARIPALLIAGTLLSANLACGAISSGPPAAKAVQPKPGAWVVKRLFVSGSAGGIAEIQVPAGWDLAGRSTPIDIRLSAPGSSDYMRITALPVPKERMAVISDDKLREILRQGGIKLLGLAVEKDLTILPLPAKASRGYYYALTNKKLVAQPDVAGEYRSMHAGVVPVGGWIALFNVFSNARDGAFARDALAAAASLRWRGAEQGGHANGDLLDGLHLARPAPPPGLQARSKLLCLSPQTRALFEQFNEQYAGLLGARLAKSSFESFDDGQGDAGSVLYMEFDAPLGQDARSFIGGLLWGAVFPDARRTDEFYVSGKQLVIWCTQADSHIKRLSQARLETLLFGAR